jgi:predicted dehydrogenase
MAFQDVKAIAGHKAVKVVAGCEVDEKRTAEFRARWPDAHVYSDYRELLEKERDLQTVNVSTPDHMHAPMIMAAMRRGLHVYGQKPLTHDIYEARRLTEYAHEKKLVTQMGIQIHSNAEYRTAVKLVQDGAIGKVREVHAWSSKSWGDQTKAPAKTDPVPDGLHWDLWLGVCAERPFVAGWYHPHAWRKRVDFGTGTFGDMGCHIYDPVFKALALTAPVRLRSLGEPPNEHSWASDAVIEYEFPGTQYTQGKTVKVTWYDGTRRPSEEIQAQGVPAGADPGQKGVKMPGQGSIFIGTEGVMVLPHIASPRLIGKNGEKIDFKSVEGGNHWHEFVDAVNGQGRASANFDYAGPLTEAVLLGSVATRFPKQELHWDAAGLKFPGVAEANPFVRRSYRTGWEMAELSS